MIGETNRWVVDMCAPYTTTVCPEDPVPFSFLLTLLEPLETAPCRSSCGRKPRQLFREDKFRSWAARLLAGRSSVCPRKQRAVLPPNPEWFCCQRCAAMERLRS